MRLVIILLPFGYQMAEETAIGKLEKIGAHLIEVQQSISADGAEHTLEFRYRRGNFMVMLRPDRALEFYLNGCLRKRRDWSGKEPQYVWTNVELEWEEHHYLEARYWAGEQRLLVTVNSDPLIDQRFPQA